MQSLDFVVDNAKVWASSRQDQSYLFINEVFFAWKNKWVIERGPSIFEFWDFADVLLPRRNSQTLLSSKCFWMDICRLIRQSTLTLSPFCTEAISSVITSSYSTACSRNFLKSFRVDCCNENKAYIFKEEGYEEGLQFLLEHKFERRFHSVVHKWWPLYARTFQRDNQSLVGTSGKSERLLSCRSRLSQGRSQRSTRCL